MTWAHIEKPTVTLAQARMAMAAGGTPAGKVDDFDAYMQRLVQLIPAEVVALYLTFHAAAAPGGSFRWWWPNICLALTVIVRFFGTRKPAGAVWNFQPIAVAVAARLVCLMDLCYRGRDRRLSIQSRTDLDHRRNCNMDDCCSLCL